MCTHRCAIVTRRGQCSNRPKQYPVDREPYNEKPGSTAHEQVSREGWPKTLFHHECTYHFNRYGFSGGPVVTRLTWCRRPE